MTEQSLREKLGALIVTVWKQTNLNGQANLDHDSVDDLMRLITQYGDTRERKGRIDELEAIYGWSYNEYGVLCQITVAHVVPESVVDAKIKSLEKGLLNHE